MGGVYRFYRDLKPGCLNTHMKNKNYELLQLLSRRKVAERLDCSIETIKRREKAGLLKPVKIGARVKFRLEDVEALVSAATVQ